MKRRTAVGTSAPQAENARRATFIVRMWTENETPGQRDWRGTVEHAQSGDRRAVAGTDDLFDLLTAWLAGGSGVNSAAGTAAHVWREVIWIVKET